MASRASLSMLVTLELRERLNELSLLSSGMEPRGGHTESKTVGGKREEVKLPVHKCLINYLQSFIQTLNKSTVRYQRELTTRSGRVLTTRNKTVSPSRFSYGMLAISPTH